MSIRWAADFSCAMFPLFRGFHGDHSPRLSHRDSTLRVQCTVSTGLRLRLVDTERACCYRGLRVGPPVSWRIGRGLCSIFNVQTFAVDGWRRATGALQIRRFHVLFSFLVWRSSLQIKYIHKGDAHLHLQTTVFRLPNEASRVGDLLDRFVCSGQDFRCFRILQRVVCGRGTGLT
jgi:hypothetical protein